MLAPPSTVHSDTFLRLVPCVGIRSSDVSPLLEKVGPKRRVTSIELPNRQQAPSGHPTVV